MRRGCRLRWLIGSLAASSALAAAGCGSGSGPSGPALGHADAQRLIRLASRVDATSGCAQQRAIASLHAAAVALVNAGRVPEQLQEPLVSGVNALVDEQPTCLPAVSPTTTTPATQTVESPPAAPPQPPAHGRGHHHEHGPGRGHGEGRHGHGRGPGHGHDPGPGAK